MSKSELVIQNPGFEIAIKIHIYFIFYQPIKQLENLHGIF